MEKQDDEEQFTTFQSKPSCSIVVSFPYDERCAYIKSSEECQEKAFFVNYIQLLYCGLQPHSNIEQWLGLLLFLVFIAVMFTILGTVADRFFCPALKVFSVVFGMSEHLAGVTLLAFGNGSPDILTSFASLGGDDNNEIFSTLLASVLYVSIFVGGMICLIRPFKMQPEGTVRDLCFLLLGGLFVEYAVVSDGHVTLGEGICVLLIYVWYLTTIILDQYLLTRSVKQMERLVRMGSMASVDTNRHFEHLRSEARMDIIVSNMSIDVDMTRKQSFNELSSKNHDLYKQLLEALNPLDMEEWQESGKAIRAFMVIKVPINLILLIIIPVVDYGKNRHGWTKLLNTVQIVTTPLLIVFLSSDLTILGVPLYVFTLIVTVPLAIVTFLMTRTDIPPKLHPVSGFMLFYGNRSSGIKILNRAHWSPNAIYL